MQLFNSLTNQKEDFIPLEKNKVKIYACGPTVYNYIHIGNARPLCVFDVLRRFLEYKGYQVDFIQNFTDIDDKIIKKANDEHSNYLKISDKYIKEYKTDATSLNIKEATLNPKATENIQEIISMISKLIDNKHAYVSTNGNVYFKTKSFKNYGQLSHQQLDALQAGARINIDENKLDPMDFALWKKAKPLEPFWESPWSAGRPGWHIECSAMAKKYLGNTIDIHCGGQDLIFPHHENEIAQSESANKQIFAKYWLHNGYVNIDNQKMSKSQGNFFTVRDIGRKYGFEPIRYLMIASHYRNPVNFSIEIIKQSIASLDRLYIYKENLNFLLQNSTQTTDVDYRQNIVKLDQYKEKFINSMEDDLNTPEALGAIFEMIKYNNILLKKIHMPTEYIKYSMDIFNELVSILGLIYEKKRVPSDYKNIQELIDQRESARKNKDWSTADKIRDELNKMGVILEDTPTGIKWRLK